MLHLFNLKNVLSITLLVTTSVVFAQTKDALKASQVKNTRVKEAYQSKWEDLQKSMSDKKINTTNYDIYLRAFKQEQVLEVWLKNCNNNQYLLFKTYAICASSGTLGPKRVEGDGQVPEGFYTIDVFNPYSSYYLSMKINYPNQSDLILKTGKKAGGDIMVHGSCVTIGCLPMTDDKIKEIYILCLEAKNRNRVVKIDIYPTRLTNENLEKISVIYPHYAKFWNTLKPAYDNFEKNYTLKKVSVDANGVYVLN